MSLIRNDMLPFITKAEIDEMIDRIAREIESDYFGEQLIFVCPLKGSFLFLSDLVRRIRLPLQVDFVQLSNVKKDGDRPAGVSITKDIEINVADKHVIVVEEIIDAGRSLSFLKNRLLSAGPASLKVASLLDKPARRVINIIPDYLGRTIEDRFVVGYGMDDDGLGRNYSDIYLLKN
ncbi:MAG: hypoxanthine phosphoribosyltransferase [Bdellovibrionales bacterium CG10_big_fil_rev_8_21_14_0_10_45_34]|nr:MAG: hypoxanthine phosphoribosyltransferase [Bdellovibrionales bacterium CG10_big_fil_rev_8_21_14_0_10_45_34]